MDKRKEGGSEGLDRKRWPPASGVERGSRGGSQVEGDDRCGNVGGDESRAIANPKLPNHHSVATPVSPKRQAATQGSRELESPAAGQGMQGSGRKGKKKIKKKKKLLLLWRIFSSFIYRNTYIEKIEANR